MDRGKREPLSLKPVFIAMSSSVKGNRRDFIRRSAFTSAGLLAFPSLVPASALGLDGTVAPSNRIALGAVGFNMGMTNLRNLMGVRGVEIVALCDVDTQMLAKGVAEAPQAKTYRDWREMFANAKLDAVTAALPDHSHAAFSIWALDRGVDVYGEKPLAHHHAESLAIVEAAHRNGRVWQTGSWQRSVKNFRHAVELVRNGRIGKIQKVEVGVPHGLTNTKNYKSENRGTAGRPPSQLDYDLWMGPAESRAYHPKESHYFWRYNLYWGTGQVGNWFTHHGDIALWGLDLDKPNRGPSEIRTTASYVTDPDGCWDVPAEFTIDADLPGGIELKTSTKMREGTCWYGEKGWIYVNRGKTEASDPKILNSVIGDGEWHAPGNTEHWRDFIECVRTRESTVAHVEAAHSAFTVGALGLISMRLNNRKLRWNPDSQKVIDDSEADALRTRRWRAGWTS